MKDKEKLSEIDGREGNEKIMPYSASILGRLFALETGELSNVSIKDCPKCKHLVMARFYYVMPKLEIGERFQCLSCGSKFFCTTECVCKVLED